MVTGSVVGHIEDHIGTGYTRVFDRFVSWHGVIRDPPYNMGHIYLLNLITDVASSQLLTRRAVANIRFRHFHFENIDLKIGQKHQSTK